MKKYLLAFLLTFIVSNIYAGESASLSGVVNTNRTIENNGFLYPQSIYTKYISNDPSEKGIILSYTTLHKIGSHTLSVEWKDKNGKKIDECIFDPINITKVPYINTVTCNWSGRQPSGGITFDIYNTYKGKKENLGQIYFSEVTQ